jgi:hypothetical protein
MKHHFFYTLICLVWASTLFAQMPPAGEKENPLAKEYEKQGKKVPKPKGIDSFEMKYLAEFIQDANVSIGVFDLPGEDEGLRTLKNGKYPEEDDAYVDVAIHQSIMKLYPIEPIKGSFDSAIFLKMPALTHEEGVELTFYPYPGTRWLLFLKQGIIKSDGTIEAHDWVRTLKNGFGTYQFLNEQTAFYFASAYYGNYYLKWSKEDIPNGLVKVDEKFIADVKDIVAFLKTVPKGIDKDSFGSMVTNLKPKLRTDKAKYLCEYLKPAE